MTFRCFAGIISSIAPAPNHQKIFAAGSYLGTVGIYSTETGEMSSIVEGHLGGITQVGWARTHHYSSQPGLDDVHLLYVLQYCQEKCAMTHKFSVCLFCRWLFQRMGIFCIQEHERTLPSIAGTCGIWAAHYTQWWDQQATLTNEFNSILNPVAGCWWQEMRMDNANFLTWWMEQKWIRLLLQKIQLMDPPSTHGLQCLPQHLVNL